MIRILLDRAFDNEHHYIHAVGLSTDAKPATGIITGSKFIAVDTGAEYLFDETSGEWNEKPSGGGGDVTDVQVDGVSVLQDGVANIPKGTNGSLGVFKASVPNGISSYSDGTLLIFSANDNEVKAGRNDFQPIVPLHQHTSTFYGLAKAAGDTTQSASSNAVGSYTDAAKSAIQTMLGISGIIAPVEGATTSKAYAIGDAFLHGGALYKASAAIAAGDAIVPGTNCTQTTIIEMLKGA